MREITGARSEGAHKSLREQRRARERVVRDLREYLLKTNICSNLSENNGVHDELRAGIMELEGILKLQTKSPVGSISMVESFDACPHEESEAHEEDDIDEEEEEEDIASATHGTVTFSELSPERRAKRRQSDPNFTDFPDFYPIRSPIAVSDPPETSLDGLELIEIYPWCKPVSLEKDARSGIPDIETKKYCVDSSMRFEDFMDFIRKQIKHRGSLFVYVNDREPETDFLMYQVYANNMDKYGLLRVWRM